MTDGPPDPGGSHLEGQQVLVTGGTGFIGSHLIRALRAAGAKVLVADLRPHPDQGIDSIAVDLRRPGVVEQVVRPGTDTIVHLAAATSVLRSVERPVETYATNVAVTLALLERARQMHVANFVFASTNAVVGRPTRLPIDEGSVLAPLTPYGATKAAAEMLLASYRSAYGMRGTALRLTNVYGAGMGGKDSIVPRLMKAAHAGTTFEVYGNGHQVRDYIDVEDVVSAMLTAMAGESSGPVVIGTGRPTSVLELVAMVRDVTGTELPLRHVASKTGEMAQVIVDNGRARALGWRPTVPLEQGLARVWATWDRACDLVAAAASEPAAGEPALSHRPA